MEAGQLSNALVGIVIAGILGGVAIKIVSTLNLGLWVRGFAAALVFSGDFRMLPGHAEMGFAALPGLHLALAFAGSIALCMVAALLMRLTWMDWLRE